MNEPAGMNEGADMNERADMNQEKTELRTAMRRTLESLSEIEVDAHSDAVQEHLFGSALWRDAGGILAFSSLPREVRTDGILTAAREAGKRVALPRVNGDYLVFHEILDDPPRLVRHVWGMQEPATDSPVADVLDPSAWPNPLVLVPGLAFDGRGHRLGRGRGFYDRFLATMSATTVGVCFQCQVVPEVPVEELDARVDYLLTETGLRRPDLRPA